MWQGKRFIGSRPNGCQALSLHSIARLSWVLGCPANFEGTEIKFLWPIVAILQLPDNLRRVL